MMGTETMPPTGLTQEDVSHLSTLALCYKILAALLMCGACVPVIHLCIGLMMMAGGSVGGAEGMVGSLFGGFFAAIAIFVMAFNGGLAWASWETASKLETRRGFQFVTVCGAVTCLNVPLGTILGVFTLIVINRPSVKAVFYENDRRAP